MTSMREQPDDPKVLRREILAMLQKVTDRGSLLFFQWLLRRIYADKPLPGDAELRELRKAFVRAFDAFKVKNRPSVEDMDLLAKWTDDDDAAMGRALGLWYSYPGQFRQLMLNGMHQDHSWAGPGQDYVNIYEFIRDK